MQKSYCCNSELRDSNYYGLGTCTKCGRLSHKYIEKETQRVPKELPRDFEEYLKDQFGKIYTGLDDDMPDRFEYWLGNLEPQQLSNYKNSFEKYKPIATNKTSITKLNTIYELQNSHGEMIEAEVHNGKLTLSNHKGYEEFVFVGSDPARIRRICELFIRACELVEETK